MSKIWLIIQREYLTRVRKKSFIIMTFLGPLLFACLWLLPFWLATEGGEQKTIEVLDESEMFIGKFQNNDEVKFVYIDGSLDSAKMTYKSSGFDGLLYIPRLDVNNPEGINFFSKNSPSLSVLSSIEEKIERVIENYRLKSLGIDKAEIEALAPHISIHTVSLTDEGEQENNAIVASAVGYIFSFMIYMFIFMYGSQVMRGVIEEKTNRIVEVIISSVKPFQLMMGKILGVAAVVLTQLVLWTALSTVAIQIISTMLGVQETAQQISMEQAGDISSLSGDMGEIYKAIMQLSFAKIIGSFIFFFLGGYLLYASLFAAIGSAVDSDTDSQQFMLPITIPLIFALISLSGVIRDPDSDFAFWMSIIPFTSPIVMVMRVPFGVDTWELLLSMALLVIGFIWTTYIAGRIYRIGILMHGSKVNYQTLVKWFKTKN
ncbi:ABC transporter permease [Aureibacter tunicatorum]|uniref:ABC-2 type transport system permease protein n=1 Tax=Aureibacter tunicatorum TaxID=866807 RepID=A0AAE3XL22_9BACT|nr:ABC transporter permease [Aureibacter tunicatorum]MDR6237885.1 ABC-2 type transport system permease protein [Aureibacter tunicatorum]BDD02920.1 ABC transporter permease [Aureibacter tunicatorum]